MEPSGGQQQENGQNGQDTKPTVCFLGPVSSYTHQATLDTFPTDKFNFLPVDTIKDIFDTTQSGRADYGVVPFENSSNGSVVFTLDQFADRAGEYPDLAIHAEIYLDVHHCLVGHYYHRSNRLNLTHVKRVYSHPQAFGQCTKFLRETLPGVETIDVSSTSRAAALAKEDATGTSAAISSATAAQMLGLDVLARNIEDREDNTTRFFVVRRRGAPVSALEEALSERRRARGHQDADGGDGDSDSDIYSHSKSLVSFTVPHRSPGALADVLECFRRARLNLTSINSRPSLAQPFQYVFFVEFEGHRLRDPEGRVRDALANVAAVAQSCRWWGSWDNMR
ncbi:PDT-domain-containing protein [Daldinia vernicosa]|uniref:PDT-domain-containing protein n=1 Tax=Daldinia vernicosa TaxID=114800 RepID=UPI002007B720|nr:PDT-domain-containing protein [Daldinia vernicosa]KAI0851026.1 PDT-domain-containing protein [Daldinia vernicosa]